MARGWFGLENYVNLFLAESDSPTLGSAGFSTDDVRGIAIEARKQISRSMPGQVINEKGKFHFSEKALDVMQSVGEVIKLITSSPESIRLPETKAERLALVKILTHSLLKEGGRLVFFCPVCPDHGLSESFYKGIGNKIGPEANGALVAAKTLSEGLLSLGFNPQFHILVADTEDDVSEIMNISAGGDIQFYKSQCQRSTKEINAKAGGGNIKASTFSNQYGDLFRKTQYKFERVLKQLKDEDQRFKEMVLGVGKARKARHTQILGREERDYELTIRYMAQYATLGNLIKKQGELSLILNYSTPNRRFFNASANIHRKIVLEDTDTKILTVLGTVVER